MRFSMVIALAVAVTIAVPAAAQAVTEAKRTNIPAMVPASLFAIFIETPLISYFHNRPQPVPAASLLLRKNTPMTG